MVVIRPVKKEDLDQLAEMAGLTGFGLTSLPQDKAVLSKRIAQSQLSFEITTDRPRGELYLFVMQDLDKDKIVGTSCIVSKVGGFEPFYAYEIRTSVHQSRALNIRKEIETLHLVAEHSGPCAIGGLFLSPEYRRHGNGRLLSLFRFLFMAQRRERFEPLVIAEMRGVVNEDGRSPFWEALGRHFFDMDFPKADYLSVKDKKFIADLMPTCPIYIPLLPSDARAVIGKVQEDTKPALKMLQDEGFEFTGMVDIFEAGPVISCPLDAIRIVRESRLAVVDEITSDEEVSPKFVITNVAEDFRACMGPVVSTRAGGALIQAGSAEALGVNIGDQISFGAIKPATTAKANE